MNWFKIVGDNFRLRPWWINGLLLFCAYMTFIYAPWDIFLKPLAVDQEVWFGILFTGWVAKATGLLHWLVYGAGTLGFWKMKRWMFPWVNLYLLQIALGMLVWNILDERGLGLMPGILVAVPFIVLAAALWRARYRFT